MSDSGDSGRIDYDEKAIMSLLDRTSSHDDAPDEEKDMLANEYLASFKVRLRPCLYGEKSVLEINFWIWSSAGPVE